MSVSVCVVCLKTFNNCDGPHQQIDNCDVPLLTKFVKFIKNYLEISSSVAMQQLLKTRSETDAFCEKCELAVINPICKVYLELLSAQLRLSWELERLGKLLENSQSDQQEGDTNLEILVGQLVIENVEQFEEFRKLLAKKCELKRNEAIPNVLLMSRCDEGRIVPSFGDYDEDLDHSLHDPFDTQSLSENRDDDEGETKPEIVIVIKTEPETLQNFENRNTELDTDADSPTTSNSTQLPHTSPTNGGSFMEKINNSTWKCLKCHKIFHNGSRIKLHFQNRHLRTRCHTCGKTIFGKEYLLKHNRLYHRKLGRYPCQTCPKVYDTREQMMVHRRKYHKTKYNCPDCDLSFTAKSNFEVHVAAIHKPPESHPCIYCQTKDSFSTRKYLQAHIRRMHPENFCKLNKRN